MLKKPSEINQGNQEPNFLDYTRSVDEQLAELCIPKQDLHKKPPVDSANPDEDSGEDKSILDFEPVIDHPPIINKETATDSAELLTELVDNMIGSGASMYAKSKNSEDYKCSPDEKQSLVRAYSKLVQETNIQVNPWYAVLGLNFSIYTPKIIQAVSDRRANIELEKYKEENNKSVQELRDEIQKLKEEKESK